MLLYLVCQDDNYTPVFKTVPESFDRQAAKKSHPKVL